MKRAERQPVGDLTLYAGIFCKVWTVPDADTVVPQHAHAHPHLTLLIAGTARVWCNNEYLGELTAPAVVKIPAHALHRFRTMTAGVTLACIHHADTVDATGDPAIAAEHTLPLED